MEVKGIQVFVWNHHSYGDNEYGLDNLGANVTDVEEALYLAHKGESNTVEVEHSYDNKYNVKVKTNVGNMSYEKEYYGYVVTALMVGDEIFQLKDIDTYESFYKEIRNK